MFYLDKKTELTTPILAKMINHFRINVEPKLNKYKKYYDGLQAILNKSYADESKPCNKTVINYCKNIVESYAGYLATPGYISYRSDNDIEDIMNVLRYNDYQAEDAAFVHDLLVYGTAAELMYLDEDAKERFRLIEPTTCFGVYNDDLTGDLRNFVRIYKASNWDESNKFYVDVYGNSTVRHYFMDGPNGNPTFTMEEPHRFSQCPANIAYLPDEKSIFDCIMSQQDSINELLSAEIDDYSAFCDAYLTLTGMDADTDEIQMMKENRVLILPEGATAAWLTKNANDAQVSNIRKSLHESIYRVAQCVDFSLENVGGGVSSGIAIRYRLTGMENRAGTIEAEVKKALQRRIEIICGIATLKLGEEYFRDIDINFNRNIPTDNAELVNLVNSLKGVVSDATLLGRLPFISDVNAELEAIKAQKQENMALYGFPGASNETEDEDEE